MRKSSWHYRLLDFFDSTPTTEVNICQYRGRVLGCMLLTVLLAVIVTLFAILLTLSALFPFVGILEGFEALQFFGGVLWVAITLMVGTDFWNKKRAHKAPKLLEERGIIYQSFRSWKDKVCYKVHFED